MRQSVKGWPRNWHTHRVVRTKPADQRREELLDAAQASFLERGIAATTVDHIAAGAGVAKGTFYLYFRSRADVLTAVQRRYGDCFVAQLVAAIAEAGDDWGAKLDGCVRVGLQNHQVERALHDVLFISAPPERGAELDHALDDLVGVFQALLADGVAAGAYEVDDIDTTAVLLFNTLHGVFNPIWLGASPFDEDRLAAAARTLFRRTVNYHP